MSGKYRTIVADPPWPFQWGGGKGGRRRRETELGYKTMTVDEIAALPVSDFADTGGANLFLWATDETYREGQAVAVARAWGFEPVGPAFIWRKDNYGVGFVPRPGHEMLMPCRTRGVKAMWLDVPELRALHSVQDWGGQARGSRNGGKQHSRKPEAALDLIEHISPAPRLEMFSRRARLGDQWDYWGDESLGTAQLPDPQPTRAERAPNPDPVVLNNRGREG